VERRSCDVENGSPGHPYDEMKWCYDTESESGRAISGMEEFIQHAKAERKSNIRTFSAVRDGVPGS